MSRRYGSSSYQVFRRIRLGLQELRWRCHVGYSSSRFRIFGNDDFGIDHPWWKDNGVWGCSWNCMSSSLVPLSLSPSCTKIVPPWSWSHSPLATLGLARWLPGNQTLQAIPKRSRNIHQPRSIYLRLDPRSSLQGKIGRYTRTRSIRKITRRGLCRGHWYWWSHD